MELQLLETVDFDAEYADMFPNSAYEDKMHPVLANRETHLAEMHTQDEFDVSADMQSGQYEAKYQKLSCVPFPFVYLTIIIKDFHTIDAEGWIVY